MGNKSQLPYYEYFSDKNSISNLPQGSWNKGQNTCININCIDHTLIADCPNILGKYEKNSVDNGCISTNSFSNINGYLRQDIDCNYKTKTGKCNLQTGQEEEQIIVLQQSQYGGKKCPTSQNKKCDVNCKTSDWSDCDEKTRMKKRIKKTINPMKNICVQEEEAIECDWNDWKNHYEKKCNIYPWQNWTQCDQKTGKQSRKRIIPSDLENKCTTLEEEECPINCVVSDWIVGDKKTDVINIPNFSGNFGSKTQKTEFGINGWKLKSSVLTNINEGLPGLLPDIKNPSYLAKDVPNNPRIVGFTNTKVIILIQAPYPVVINGIDFFGGGGLQNQPKDIVIRAKSGNIDDWNKFGSFNEIIKSVIPQNPVDSNITSPYKLNFDNSIPYTNWKIEILSNYGSGMTKLGGIRLYGYIPTDKDGFSLCTADCGGGIQTRTRKITKDPNKNGIPCPNLKETIFCNNDPCPIQNDCKLSGWSEWTKCDPISGTQTRKQSILVKGIKPGKLCPEEEDKYFQKQKCEIPCQVSEWSKWSDCSASTGKQFRSRTKVQDAVNSDKKCPTNLFEEENCNIDCVVSDWKKVSECDPTSGKVIVSRNILQKSYNNGKPCPTNLMDNQSCDVDCNMGEWSNWDICNIKNGKQTRIRDILDKNFGKGKGCEKKEDTKECKIDCKVGEWSEWSTCDPNTLTKTRNREIIQSPLNGGNSCPPLLDSMPCYPECSYSNWSDWSSCDPISGTQTRTRTSSDKNCLDLTETKSCQVDCEVGDWTPYTQCSKNCGGGKQTRSRNILVQPLNGGKVCPQLEESQDCNILPCSPNDCQVGEWGDWSDCTKTCGGGEKVRTRKVIQEAGIGGRACPPLKETATCNTQNCPTNCKVSDWSNWTSCDINGVQTRVRRVMQHQSPDGIACPELKETQNCPIDCDLSPWGNWTKCDEESGMQTRNRFINQQSFNGGKKCDTLIDTQKCSVDCRVSDWNDWSKCDDNGKQVRTRNVVVKAMNGGNECPGLKETRSCMTPELKKKIEDKALKTAASNAKELENAKEKAAAVVAYQTIQTKKKLDSDLVKSQKNEDDLLKELQTKKMSGEEKTKKILEYQAAKKNTDFLKQQLAKIKVVENDAQMAVKNATQSKKIFQEQVDKNKTPVKDIVQEVQKKKEVEEEHQKKEIKDIVKEVVGDSKPVKQTMYYNDFDIGNKIYEFPESRYHDIAKMNAPFDFGNMVDVEAMFRPQRDYESDLISKADIGNENIGARRPLNINVAYR